MGDVDNFTSCVIMGEAVEQEVAPFHLFDTGEFSFSPSPFSGVRPGHHPEPAPSHRGLHQGGEPDPGGEPHRGRGARRQVGASAIGFPTKMLSLACISKLECLRATYFVVLCSLRIHCETKISGNGVKLVSAEPFLPLNGRVWPLQRAWRQKQI